jgi:hypothetical protein
MASELTPSPSLKRSVRAVNCIVLDSVRGRLRSLVFER